MYILDKIILLMMVLDSNSLDYKIAEFIIYNKQIACNLTIRELASKIYVSPSTILRFVKKLGIDDYKLFREFLAQDVNEELHDLQSRKPLAKELIENFNQSIDTTTLNDMLEKIKTCKRLCIHCPVEYALLFKEVVQLLRTQERTVDVLAYKNSKDKIDILEQLEEDDVIFCLFPSYSYYSWETALHHLEEEFVHVFEAKKCHKYFAGQSTTSHDNCHMINLTYTPYNTINRVTVCCLNDYMIDYIIYR